MEKLWFSCPGYPGSVSDPLSSGSACPMAMSSEGRDVLTNTSPKQRQDAEIFELLILALTPQDVSND